MEYLKRLLDPVIALSTVANICAVLVLVGLIGTVESDLTTKITTIVIASLIQLGVMKQPSNTKI